MGAWTVNSLTAPVTRGIVAPTTGSIDPKYIGHRESYGTNVVGSSTTTNTQPNTVFSTIMDSIFGSGNWQKFMSTGDQSGQVGNTSTLTPEMVYAQSAAKLMNAKSAALGQAYNPWTLNRLRREQDRLSSSGAGLGMSSSDASRYNTLAQQITNQQDQMALWNKTAASIGASNVFPMQQTPKNQSSGWLGGSTFSFGG